MLLNSCCNHSKEMKSTAGAFKSTSNSKDISPIIFNNCGWPADNNSTNSSSLIAKYRSNKWCQKIHNKSPMKISSILWPQNKLNIKWLIRLLEISLNTNSREMPWSGLLLGSLMGSFKGAKMPNRRLRNIWTIKELKKLVSFCLRLCFLKKWVLPPNNSCSTC